MINSGPPACRPCAAVPPSSMHNGVLVAVPRRTNRCLPLPLPLLALCLPRRTRSSSSRRALLLRPPRSLYYRSRLMKVVHRRMPARARSPAVSSLPCVVIVS